MNNSRVVSKIKNKNNQFKMKKNSLAVSGQASNSRAVKINHQREMK